MSLLLLFQEPAPGGPTYTLAADAGAFVLTGNDAGLSAGRKLAAATGVFTLTGNPAGLIVSRNLIAATGSFTLSGNDAALKAARVIAAQTGVLTLAGNPADLVYSGESILPIRGCAHATDAVVTLATIADAALFTATVSDESC